jgi:hypothetical protein
MKLRRKWARFSLAGLLLFIAIVGCACKYVLDVVRLHANQYDTIVTLVESPEDFFRHIGPRPGHSFGTGGRGGGVIQGCFEHPDGWVKDASDWLDIKYDVDVVSFRLAYNRPDLAHDLEIMRGLPKLKALHLDHCDVTDEMLEIIKQMDWLEKLTFGDTNIAAETAHAVKLAMRKTHIQVTHTEVRPSLKYRAFAGEPGTAPGDSVGIIDVDLP